MSDVLINTNTIFALHPHKKQLSDDYVCYSTDGAKQVGWWAKSETPNGNIFEDRLIKPNQKGYSFEGGSLTEEQIKKLDSDWESFIYEYCNENYNYPWMDETLPNKRLAKYIKAMPKGRCYKQPTIDIISTEGGKVTVYYKSDEEMLSDYNKIINSGGFVKLNAKSTQ